MSSKRSICYISSYFWPEEIGSAPYSHELAKFLSENNFDLSVVSFRPHYPNIEAFESWQDGSRDEEVVGELLIERVPVSARGKSGLLKRIKNDLNILLRLLKNAFSKRAKNYDLIVSYVPGVLTLYGAKAIALRSNAPVVAIVHDIESGLANALNITSNKIIFHLMRFVERVGLNFCDEVVVLTDGMKQHLVELGCRKPIRVIPIWSEVYKEVELICSDSKTIMYSGNFGKKQNLDQLFPLFRYMADKHPEHRVLLRGAGSEKERLEKKIESSGLINVKFSELVSANELVKSLQRVDIHLVPQALNVANYALPSKLISIMAAGRPFVCIAEQGSLLDELALQSKAGICVYPGDVEGLNHAVAKLLQDVELQNQMGLAGRRFVEQNFSREVILSKYSALIDAYVNPSK